MTGAYILCFLACAFWRPSGLGGERHVVIISACSSASSKRSLGGGGTVTLLTIASTNLATRALNYSNCSWMIIEGEVGGGLVGGTRPWDVKMADWLGGGPRPRR